MAATRGQWTRLQTAAFNLVLPNLNNPGATSELGLFEP